MKITEVSASYGRKKSDGNFGSRDVFLSLSAEIGPEEDAKEVQQALFSLCHEMVMSQYEAGEPAPEQVTPQVRPRRNYKSDKQEIFLRGQEEVLGAIETPASVDAVVGVDGSRGSQFEG